MVCCGPIALPHSADVIVINWINVSHSGGGKGLNGRCQSISRDCPYVRRLLKTFL